MRRALSALLIVVASFGIVHGDLLRPCECGPQNPLSCGACPTSRAARPQAPRKASCCCHERAAPEQQPASPERAPCSICPGPRAPRDVPPLATALEPPLAVGVVALPPETPVLAPASPPRARCRAPPTDPTWRISPEGLTVFLT